MSDTAYIRGKLLQMFTSNSQAAYQKKLEKLAIISSICDSIISEITSLDDKSLKSFIKFQRKRRMYTNMDIDTLEARCDRVRDILKVLETQNLKSLNICHEKLGKYST